MPTFPPPPDPPAIQQHYLNLGDRLDAASAQLGFPDEPGRTASTSLVHVPSQVWSTYGTDAAGKRVLALDFRYLDDVPEGRQVDTVSRTMDYDTRVDLHTGNRSGRIYRLELVNFDLREESVRTFSDGIDACLQGHFKDPMVPLRRRVILKAIARVVKTHLPGLVQELRSAT